MVEVLFDETLKAGQLGLTSNIAIEVYPKRNAYPMAVGHHAEVREVAIEAEDSCLHLMSFQVLDYPARFAILAERSPQRIIERVLTGGAEVRRVDLCGSGSRPIEIADAVRDDCVKL